MIAAWMAYCALAALWFGLAALLAERALLRGRRPVRFAWTAAIALSLALPAGALLLPGRRAPAAGSGVGSASAEVVASARAPNGDPRRTAIATATPTATPERPSRDWSTTLARADRVLTIAWGLGTGALSLHLAGGILLLARRRRRWPRRHVLGVPVLVSTASGPAVVGLRAAAIVLPAWALPMEPARLALMLRHEQEHVHARDGLLLWAARLVAVAMPWNPALWWMLARLRAAVEIDCDARVLRGLREADVRSYATLLLDVVRPNGGVALGAPAFAERADQLERRIRVMARRRAPASRGLVAAAGAVGVAAVALACEAPRPRGVTGVASVTDAAASMRGASAQTTPAPALPNAAELTSGPPGCDAIPWKSGTAHLTVVVADTSTPGRFRIVAQRAGGGAMRVAYAALPAAAAAVRCTAPPGHQILLLYGRNAFAPTSGAVVTLELDRPTDVAVSRAGDGRVIASVLIDPDTLPATPGPAVVELAWPNAVLAARRPGEICGSSGLVVDGVWRDRCAPPTAAQLAAARQARAARADRAMPSIASPARVGGVATTYAERAAEPGDSLLVARNTYDRLFRGIALNPDQEARARAVIQRSTGEGLRLMHGRTGSPWEGFRRVTAMLDTRDAALRALLATETDRRTFAANAASMRP